MTKGGSNVFDVTVVVNGERETVQVNENAPIRTLMEKALEDQAGNLEGWQLKSEDGKTVFDPEAKIGAAGISAGMTLFLSKIAGAAG